MDLTKYVMDCKPTSSVRIDELLQDYDTALKVRGSVTVGSGSFSNRGLWGSIHTDLGPKLQDKDLNQDYALAWIPNSGSRRLFLAIADGLTSSYRSELAAAVSCWSAMLALADNASVESSEQLAVAGMNAAGASIGMLVDIFASKPEASCPDGQYLSTWKYILRQGRLLQTTLTLVWIENDILTLAMIGDGGAIMREYAPDRHDHTLASSNLATQEVNAIGPANRAFISPDVLVKRNLAVPFISAIYTDGLERGRHANPSEILDSIEEAGDSERNNDARSYIESAIAKAPSDFDDNLTLAIVRTI